MIVSAIYGRTGGVSRSSHQSASSFQVFFCEIYDNWQSVICNKRFCRRNDHEVEIYNQRADLASKISPFVSMRWIATNIFNLSEDEIEAVETEVFHLQTNELVNERID